MRLPAIVVGVRIIDDIPSADLLTRHAASASGVGWPFAAGRVKLASRSYKDCQVGALRTRVRFPPAPPNPFVVISCRFSDKQTYWVGPTWFRRGEDAEADGSKGDARNAHNLVNANDDVYAVAA